jgi:hypothetical protein
MYLVMVEMRCVLNMVYIVATLEEPLCLVHYRSKTLHLKVSSHFHWVFSVSF